MSKLIRYAGVRTANGIAPAFVWTTGQVKDGKYLPVFPISLKDMDEGRNGRLEVVMTKLPKAMTEPEALKYLAGHKDFASHKAFLEAEIAESTKKLEEQVKAAKELIEAVDGVKKTEAAPAKFTKAA